jgi:hypothetical protein
MKKTLLLPVALFCSFSFAFAQTDIRAKKAAATSPYQNMTAEQKLAAITADEKKRKDESLLQEKKAALKNTPVVLKPGTDTRFSKIDEGTATKAAPQKQN